MMSYVNLARSPDKATVFCEDRRLRLREEDGGCWHADGTELRIRPEVPDGLRLTFSAPNSAVRHLCLRWQGRFPDGSLFLGDHWERGYGDLEWRGMVAERIMPWYFLVHGGGLTHGYGVATGANAMGFWQVDSEGTSLWLDTRCGGKGVELGSRQLEIACLKIRRGVPDESPFEAACDFCRSLCGRPVLPGDSVYGSNNWYYAYGQSSQEEIIDDAKIIADLADENENRPWMTIDSCWQKQRSEFGGPWCCGNGRFPDMPGLAEAIRDCGAKPGIWYRPLLTTERLPGEWLLDTGRFSSRRYPGVVLDPSVPEVLELVAADVRRLKSWGYDLIKHDFSPYDIFGRWGFDMGFQITDDGWRFADQSRTTAEIIQEFYRTIKYAAENTIIIGCNTVSHLAAGVFDLQRTGDDTDGRGWERSRKMGINTLAFRMPQHGAFYIADADCVPVTERVPWKYVAPWLSLVARSGTALLVSIDPKALGQEQRKALRDAMKAAAVKHAPAQPLDWMNNTCPVKWQVDGNAETYDWYADEGIDLFPQRVPLG